MKQDVDSADCGLAGRLNCFFHKDLRQGGFRAWSRSTLFIDVKAKPAGSPGGREQLRRCLQMAQRCHSSKNL